MDVLSSVVIVEYILKHYLHLILKTKQVSCRISTSSPHHTHTHTHTKSWKQQQSFKSWHLSISI